jgi:hypothetical protein
MQHPSNEFIKPEVGSRWLGLDVEQCVRKSATEPATATNYNFQAVDKSGGIYSVDGSSWEDWPPLPQYPYERRIQPDQCARGWMLVVVAKNAQLTAVEFTNYWEGGSDVIAEWRLR